MYSVVLYFTNVAYQDENYLVRVCVKVWRFSPFYWPSDVSKPQLFTRALVDLIRCARSVDATLDKMVRAWYMDVSNTDRRLPHMTDPPRFLDLDDLKAKTGILYYKVIIEA